MSGTREPFLREFEADFCKGPSVRDATASDGATAQKIRHLPRLVKYREVDTKRTLPVHFAGDKPYECSKNLKYNTTYGMTMKGEANSTVTHHKKCMVGTANFSRSVNRMAPRETDDAVLPSHPEGNDARYFETTNESMYQTLPQKTLDGWEKDPPKEKGNDDRFMGSYPATLNPNAPDKGPFFSNSRHFFRTSQWHKDSYDRTVRADLPRGKCGARGELVRHPGESGGQKGASVWLDRPGHA